MWLVAGLLAAGLWLAAVVIQRLRRRRTRTGPGSLKDVIVVVTGGSRGLGKGVALALGECGATVYLTGRSRQADGGSGNPMLKGAPLPGSIEETAALVTARGGVGIARAVDHRDDEQVRALFEEIAATHGRLDVLVNNAIWIRDDLQQKPPFWRQEIGVFDAYHAVGLRSGYVAAVMAVPLLLKSTLPTAYIFNISSPGAVRYLFNVAYGTAKAGLDRMTRDMAVDLARDPDARSKVAAVGLWPGMVATERMLVHRSSFLRMFGVDVQKDGESPEFTGRVIAAVVADPAARQSTYSGRILTLPQLADVYGTTDVDGRVPANPASWRFILTTAFPAWLRAKIFGHAKDS